MASSTKSCVQLILAPATFGAAEQGLESGKGNDNVQKRETAVPV